MPLIPYPNVPNLPGVPAVPRSPNFPTIPPVAKAGLGMIEGMLWRALRSGSKWGIFDADGKALGDVSKITGILGGMLDSIGIGSTLSTLSLDFSKESRVSDFPVDGGGFASYNKVDLAARPVVTLCMGGSEKNRTEFLTAIESARASMGLYTVVTPEITYRDYTIESYGYQRRASSGVSLLIVELHLHEVRQVAATYGQSQIAAPQDPGATPAADGGKVQAQTPKTSLLSSIASSLKVP